MGRCKIYCIYFFLNHIVGFSILHNCDVKNKKMRTNWLNKASTRSNFRNFRDLFFRSKASSNPGLRLSNDLWVGGQRRRALTYRKNMTTLCISFILLWFWYNYNLCNYYMSVLIVTVVLMLLKGPRLAMTCQACHAFWMRQALPRVRQFPRRGIGV